MRPHIDDYWFGSESAYYECAQVLARFDAGALVEPSDATAEAEDGGSWRYSRAGNLAIIPVKGSLANRGPEWLTEFGVTPYLFIRNALVEASMDPDVTSILLDVDTPGGAVAGVSDIGHLIKQVDKSKPVYAYTGGMMASAGYWLGSVAREIAAAPIADVGSIGVIATHFSVKKAMEQEGVTATVVRAGKYKALASPYEELSEEAQAEMQAHLNTLYDLFVDHVALARDKPKAYVREHMAEGRVFLGEAAKDVGLVDKIAGLDAYVGELAGKARKRAEASQNGGTMARQKKVLMEAQEVAAIAEGADVDTVLQAAAVVPADEGTEIQGETPEIVTGDTPATVAEAVTEIHEPTSAETTQESEIVIFLKAELAAKDGQIAALSADKLALETKLDQANASHDALRGIANAAFANRSIALYGQAMDLTNFGDDVFLAEYAKVDTAFKSRFPIGGVASIEDKADEQPVVISPMDKARRRAAKV